jgi:hypothetical protein
MSALHEREKDLLHFHFVDEFSHGLLDFCNGCPVQLLAGIDAWRPNVRCWQKADWLLFRLTPVSAGSDIGLAASK